MPNDLDHIRAALEHHIALYGSVVMDEEVATVEEAVPPAPESTGEAPKPAAPKARAAATELPLTPKLSAVAPNASQTPPKPAAPRAPVQPIPSITPLPTMYERIAALIPADSPLNAMQSLQEVSDYVANTALIELDKTRLNPVFGVGNPTSDLLVIGEAPGAEEDKKGEPFVGRAGQLLTDILKAIGFEREDVYIANILKSRPPNNRDPLPDEIKAHIPILHKQIVLIQPKLILCVGRTSGTSLLGIESTLKDMRGIFHDYHGIPVMVTYHPAALLRNSNWKRPTWEDVQKLRAKYDELSA